MLGESWEGCIFRFHPPQPQNEKISHMTASDPAAYRSKVTKPADFAEFWQDVLREAESIPLNAAIIPDPLRTTPEVDVFEVHYDSLDGVRVAGWYCLPRQRDEPLPAQVFYPGYISEPTLPKAHAARGYATFGVAPRGKLRSNSQFNPGYPGLLAHNIVDRHTYAYKGFYVDAWRAIDFLRSQPEVDGQRIGVRGSSQGGALTLLAAAVTDVAVAAAGAPYLAGMIDAIELTHTYPYQEINDFLRLHPEQRDAVAETLAYYDCINFADRITCPILVNIGLNDNVCPPETGFAVFDMIASQQKKLYPYAGHGHDGGRMEHEAIIDNFFAEHLMPA
jgi:cephalosporin-C deacetylase